MEPTAFRNNTRHLLASAVSKHQIRSPYSEITQAFRRSVIEGEQEYGHVSSGFAARPAHGLAESGLYHCGCRGTRARYRGEYRDFFSRQYRPSETTPVSRPEPPRRISQHVTSRIGTG